MNQAVLDAEVLPDILTTQQMYEVDRAAEAAGVSSLELMENAGIACADAIVARVEPCPTLVLCGPGNNGGDGFVIARLLQVRGWPVTVAVLGSPDSLTGDAAEKASLWHGPVCSFAEAGMEEVELVVDSIFGAGLSRPVAGELAQLIQTISDKAVSICAVDVPSGIDGTSGQVMGAALRANFTVTFFRRKPAHVLYPGREYCGEVIVADIGIPAEVLDDVNSNIWENTPALWSNLLPWPGATSHKYDRGHAAVVSGDELHTGAARLGAAAALRTGAGLVTIVSPPDAATVNAVHLTAIMLREFESAEELATLFEDKRLNAALIGPAAGVSSETRFNVEAILRGGAATVLDADALTSFEATPSRLFDAILAMPNRPVVMTPHAGEFSRVFHDLKDETSKLGAAATASRQSGAVVVFKGPDTVVAAPDGRISINSHASPWLATAGSGDVLAGIILGLLAQGMPVFEAASAAVWLHGEVGIRLGCGLIADDLPHAIPSVLSSFQPDK